MKKISCKKWLLFFLLSLAIQPGLSAHPLGMTITNLKYSNGSLIFSTRIFYRDFLCEFQKEVRNKNKNFIKSGIDKEDQKDFSKYIQRNISIRVNDRLLTVSKYTINFEPHEEKDYMLLIDISYKTKIVHGSKIKIRNTILFNTLTSEKHLIYVSLKEPTTFSHSIITLDKDNPEFEFVND